MARTFAPAFAAVALLALSGCGLGASDEEASAPEPTALSSAQQQEAADLTLLRSFIKLATSPSTGRATEVPLAEEVQLGLGSDLVGTVTAKEASKVKAWTLTSPSFHKGHSRFVRDGSVGDGGRHHLGPLGAIKHLCRVIDCIETTLAATNHAAG